MVADGAKVSALRNFLGVLRALLPATQLQRHRAVGPLKGVAIDEQGFEVDWLRIAAQFPRTCLATARSDKLPG
jgi:hypothetical protein